jgi:16S rRNA G966 N2-methylase RsmD
LGRNLLFYGDNLDVLRNRIPSASVDLVYLDPPFNSNRSYNVLFRHRSGAEAQARSRRSMTPGSGRRNPSRSTEAGRG